MDGTVKLLRGTTRVLDPSLLASLGDSLGDAISKGLGSDDVEASGGGAQGAARAQLRRMTTCGAIATAGLLDGAAGLLGGAIGETLHADGRQAQGMLGNEGAAGGAAAAALNGLTDGASALAGGAADLLNPLNLNLASLTGNAADAAPAAPATPAAPTPPAFQGPDPALLARARQLRGDPIGAVGRSEPAAWASSAACEVGGLATQLLGGDLGDALQGARAAAEPAATLGAAVASSVFGMFNCAAGTAAAAAVPSTTTDRQPASSRGAERPPPSSVRYKPSSVCEARLAASLGSLPIRPDVEEAEEVCRL